MNILGTLLSMLPMVSRWDDDPRHDRGLPEWVEFALIIVGVVVGFICLVGLLGWLLISAMTKTDGPYQITSGKKSYITEQYLAGASDGCLHFETREFGKVRVCGDYTVKKINDASYMIMGGR